MNKQQPNRQLAFPSVGPDRVIESLTQTALDVDVSQQPNDAAQEETSSSVLDDFQRRLSPLDTVLNLGEPVSDLTIDAIGALAKRFEL